jgi:HK97 family phage major capsid protein/HK97 family phage prohead protease
MSQTPAPSKTRKRYLQITPPSDDNKIKFIFATESPVEYPTFNEILICEPEFVDLVRFKKDAMALLFNHNWDDLIGTITKIWFEDLEGAKRLCGEALLNPEGKHFSDIKAGILKSISVGYEPEKVIRKSKGENGKEDFYFSWNPHEISLVTVPADPDAKVIRRKVAPITTPVAAQVEVKPESRAAPSNASQGAIGRNLLTMKTPMTLDEINTALELGDKFKCGDLVKRSLRDNKDLTEIRAAILAEMASKPVPQFDAKETKEIKKRYSLLRAIRSQLPQYRNEDNGFETEISAEIAKRSGKNPNGIYIPHVALKRDFTVAGTNGYSVETIMGDAVYQNYANTVTAKAGVSFLGGMQGNLALPVMGTGVAAYWVGEGNSPTESAPAMSQVKAEPHTIGGFVDITRQMMIQSNPAADQLVTNDLTKIIEVGIDNAFFNTGISNAPDSVTAMLVANSVSQISVTDGAPTLAEMLGFEAQLMTANVSSDNAKFVMSPAVWALLSATPRASGQGGFMIDNGKCLGKDYLVTSLVDGIVFGDYTSSVIVGYGAGLDITVDTSTLSSSGGIRVIALQDMDFLHRNKGAYAWATAANIL